MIFLPHLETDITSACQLSCVACNHHVPMYRAKGAPVVAEPKQMARDLNHLAKFLRADRWGALGGEPTLHFQLVDLLLIARDSGVADQTEVWTNGLTLQRMRPAFWRAFDILVLSVYPGKHDETSLDWIIKKCQDEHVELVVKDERLTPNFMTLFEPISTDAAATKAKFAGCFFRHFSRVANRGFFFTCCCAPHMLPLVQGQSFGTDGIPIEDSTEGDVRAYLNRTEPLGACTMCAGRDTAQPLAWREEKNPALWQEASAGR